jgi:uncharacterized protein YeaO (DUF488 family)
MTTQVDTYRYGEPRGGSSALRIGVTRRPPRGVKESDWASGGYMDAWLRVLSPSEDLLAFAHSGDDEKTWATFKKRYLAEMKASSEAKHTIHLLAQLARRTPISLGCVCARDHCHRFLLADLVKAAG